MQILGIDCSSKRIDCVMLAPNGAWISSASFSSEVKDMDIRGYEVAKLFEEWVMSSLINGSDYVAFIENPIYMQNIKTTVGITQVIAMAKFVLRNNEVEVIGVDNKSWKKSVLSDGKADKEKIYNFAKARWGDLITSQDVADSSLLALFGVGRFGDHVKFV